MKRDPINFKKPYIRKSILLTGALFVLLGTSSLQAWWDKEWGARKEFTIDTTSAGGNITEPIGETVVLLRLHQGNFQFENAKDDGSDIRFVAEDDKTLLPFHIEKYDPLMSEAFVWVKLPEVKSGGQTKFWLYSGNTADKGENGRDSNATYGDTAALVYHFGQGSAPPADYTKNGNTAENAGTPSEGSMIGSGVRFLGATPLNIPAKDSLDWSKSAGLTFSAWIKAASLAPNAVLFNREQDGSALRIGLDNGVPYVEVKDASGTKKSPAGQPISANAWKNIAVTSDKSKFVVYVDGETYAELPAALPPLTGPMQIGATEGGFVGELDELQISNAAKSAGAIKMAAIGESGSDRSTKLLTAAEDEGGGGGHGGIAEHLFLFIDISKSLTFDGWAVIFLCAALAGVGWYVAIRKFRYLNRIKKSNDEFLKQWSNVATDLTQLDHNDTDNIKSLGGKAVEEELDLMEESPIYHVYHIGSAEIRHRMQNTKKGFKGLSARSIQAIRASLDGGLAREAHKLNGDLVFLTISIAGGPYLGLLGTVIGVMITFATIAKTGEVEVNSIAPGIAGALLATVAGLLVAIPALFIYSYLNARIKHAIGAMQMFIDEFISKVAEFYPSASE